MFDWDQRPHILNYWFPQIIFVWAPRSVVFPDVVTAKTTPSWRHWRAPVLVTCTFHLSRGRGDTRTRACPQNCACAIVLFSCIPKTVHVRFVESHRVSVHWCSLNRRHGVWSQQVLGEDNVCHCIGSLTLNIRLEFGNEKKFIRAVNRCHKSTFKSWRPRRGGGDSNAWP